MHAPTWARRATSPRRDSRAATRAQPTLTASRLAPLGLILALALLAWVGMRQLSLPAITPASAPASEFSAARAMDDLRVIAADSRSVGLPGNAAARDYLMAQLRALGLEPRVQTTTVVLPAEGGDEGFGAGTVNNVVVRIPGAHSTGAIALDAHYDSGNTGPGASDNGSGVVTALETVRAILAGPALQNDVIVVFADGEEVGMMGAAAFNQHDPWAADVRLALNLESQGRGGPAFLYVTSKDNDWVVSEFLKVAPHPSAYSLLPTISNLYPSGRLDCDLGEYTKRGSPGLGFVYASDPTAYHTVRDNVTEIDPRSVQQEGGYTLALVRHFGNRDLTSLPHSGDAVFFTILPGVVVHYATGWVLPLTALTTLLLAGLLALGLRRGQLTARGLLGGTFAFLGGTLATVALSVLLWFAVRTLNPDYQVMLIGSYQTLLYVVALMAAALALMAAFYAVLARRVRRHNLTAGALLGWALLLWLLSLTVPGMSYLATWPLLFGMLPLAWVLLAPARAGAPWRQAAVLSIAAAPAIVLLPGTLYQMLALITRFEGITGVPLLGVAMLFVAPLLGLFVPHLRFLAGDANQRRWLVPAVAGALAVTLIVWGNATSGFDAQHPRPDRIAYELNADSGQARWVSLDQHLDAWTGQFFPAGAARADHDSLLLGAMPAYTAPAPLATVAAPEIVTLDDTLNGDVRTVRLRVTSPRGAAQMSLDVNAPGEIVAADVSGRPLDLGKDDAAPRGSLKLFYANVPAAGFELTLAVRSTAPITIAVEEVKDGLPAVPGVIIAPRPADTMPAPGFPRDATVVTKTYRV